MWHILNLHNSICTHTDRYVCVLYAWCVYVYIYMNKLRSKTETNVTIHIVTEQNVIHFLMVYKWYKYEERGKTVDCGLNALTATQFSVRTNVTVRDQKHSQQYFSVPLIKKWESIFPLPELSTGFHQHNVAKVMVYKLKTWTSRTKCMWFIFSQSSRPQVLRGTEAYTFLLLKTLTWPHHVRKQIWSMWRKT